MSGIAWTNIFFYNKQLLDEAGLDSESPPSTWDEWREASLQMTRRTGDGRLSQVGTHIPGVLEVAYWNGADMWGTDWRTANVSDASVEQSATFLRDLIVAQTGSWAEYNSFWGSGFNHAFYRGQAAFWRQNSSAFSHLKNFDIDWGAALVPASGYHADARPVGLVESTWAYAIPASLPSEKLEATWKLLKWLTTYEEAAGWFARVQGRPSPVTDFNRHRDYLHENQYWNVVIESAGYVEFAPPVNLTPVRGHLNAIMRGDINPQQGLEAAQLALQNELDRYWQALD